MAKRKQAAPRRPRPAKANSQPCEAVEKVHDATDAAVEKAAATYDRAADQLRRARACCDDARQEVVERLRQLREGPAGDTWRQVRQIVRRYPGPSVIVAVLVGIFLGRSLRR